jgi:hypothetical protein
VITRYVNTASSAGGDGTTNATSGANRAFATLEAARASLPGTLTDATEIICEGSAADTAAVTAITNVTTAANYLEIRVEQANRHAGVWNTNKYRLTRANADVLTISANYIRLIGLQTHITATDSASGDDSIGIVTIAAGGSDIRIQECIVRSAAGATNNETCIDINDADATVNIRNCIIYGGGAAGSSGAGIKINAATAVTIQNCTVIHGDSGINRTAGTVTVDNTYVAVLSGSTCYNGTMTCTTCAHSSASVVTGSTASIANSTANFVNVTPGSEDYHLVTGASATLKTGGTDLSGTFTTDIDGETRSDWAIGADEYSAPAGASSYTFTGPTTGLVNVASTNFTLTPNGTFTGTITPATDGAGSFTPSSLTWTAESGGKTCTYTPTSISGSPHTLSVTDDGGLTDPANIDYTVTTGTVVITTPTQYRTFQRTTDGSLAGTPGGTTGSISITGTYTGSPTAIEASFNGGAYVTIDAAPAGGTYSATLTGQTAGQGTLTVRFTNDTSVSATVADVGIGDVVLIVGQSNAEGRLTAAQSYSHATLKGTMFAQGASAWANLADPTDSGTSNGSYWPLLATEWMTDQSVPVAFITGAAGGSGLVDGAWQPGGANYITATGRVTTSGVNSVRLVIKYQGETDALVPVTRANYLAALILETDGYAADVAGDPKTVVFMFAQSAGMDAQVPLAISDGWDAGGNIIGGPVIYDHSNVLHPTSAGDPSATGQLIARRIWAAVDAGIFNGGNGRGPKAVSIRYSDDFDAITVKFDQTLKTGLTHTAAGFVVTGNGAGATISSISYAADPTAVVLNLAAPADLPILVTMGIGTSSSGKTYPQSVDVTSPSAATFQMPAEPFETETATETPPPSTGRAMLGLGLGLGL